MNHFFHVLLVLAVFGFTFSAVQRAFGESDAVDYWHRHWASYDDTTRPSSTWHSSHITRLGGGSYHYDRDLARHHRSAISGGSSDDDGDLNNAYIRSNRRGGYHSQRSYYRVIPRRSSHSYRTTPWLPFGIR
jgi:hypothetical protein